MRSKLLFTFLFQLVIVLLLIFVGVGKHEPSPAPPGPSPIKRKKPVVPLPSPSPSPVPTPPPGACDGQMSTFKWKDYASKARSLEVWVCKENYEAGKLNRQSSRGKTHYRQMLKHDLPLMSDLIEKYRKLVKDDSLSIKESIETIAASVQQIPYTLVHPYTHAYWDSIPGKNYMKQYHKKRVAKFSPLDQVGGCLELVEPNGVVSPMEFLWHHMGDCDSRTTFLYGVFKSLGLDVIVIAGPSGPSPDSGHALLAFNIPNPSGYQHYKHMGKKYYLLETTNFSRKHTRIGVYSNRYFSQHTWSVQAT